MVDGIQNLDLSKAARIIENGGRICSVTPNGRVSVVNSLSQLCGRFQSCKIYPYEYISAMFEDMFLNKELSVDHKVSAVLLAFGDKK